MHITIVYTLPTARAKQSQFFASDQDTLDTAEEIAVALRARRATVKLFPIDEHSYPTISRLSDTDCIFNLIDWDGPDLEISLAAWKILEDTGIPFTGSSHRTFLQLSDKAKMKAALRASNLPVPQGVLLKTLSDISIHEYRYPAIVKLANENCSIGLSHDSVCNDQNELSKVVCDRFEKYKEPVLVEDFLDGREFQVSVFDLEKTGITVLPPAEIIYQKTGTEAFLTYESRWDESHADYHASTVRLADLDKKLLDKITVIGQKTFRALGFCGYTRLDIRCQGDEPYILEPNVNPGLGDDDEYGMTLSYKALGMNFEDIVWEIVKAGMRR